MQNDITLTEPDERQTCSVLMGLARLELTLRGQKDAEGSITYVTDNRLTYNNVTKENTISKCKIVNGNHLDIVTLPFYYLSH